LSGDVFAFIAMAVEKNGSPCCMNAQAKVPGPPLWLLLELTYRCRCTACSATTDGFRPDGTGTVHRGLARVLREARALGAVQLGLSAANRWPGRPGTHRREAHRLVLHQSHHLRRRLNETRIAALKAAGLDHIQLSFQDSSKQ